MSSSFICSCCIFRYLVLEAAPLSTISEENVTFNFPGEVLDDTYNGVEYDPNGHRATVTVEKDNKTLKENQDYTTSIFKLNIFFCFTIPSSIYCC